MSKPKTACQIQAEREAAAMEAARAWQAVHVRETGRK